MSHIKNVAVGLGMLHLCVKKPVQTSLDPSLVASAELAHLQRKDDLRHPSTARQDAPSVKSQGDGNNPSHANPSNPKFWRHSKLAARTRSQTPTTLTRRPRCL